MKEEEAQNLFYFVYNNKISEFSQEILELKNEDLKQKVRKKS
jgi:hypothetical protein